MSRMLCPQVIDAVFHSMDKDDSGVVGFDELYEFIHGHRHSLDARNKRVLHLSIVPPNHATLDELRWDGDVGVWALRNLLIDMLLRAKAGPADLLREWLVDSYVPPKPPVVAPGLETSNLPGPPRRRQPGGAAEHVRGLNRVQFVECVRKLFMVEDADPQWVCDLWESELRTTAHAAFDDLLKQVLGTNRLMHVTAVHLHRWLMIPHDDFLEEVTDLSTRVLMRRRLDALQRKSDEELARHRSRRRAAAVAAAKSITAGQLRVDWVQKARGQIASYCSLPTERAVASAERRVLIRQGLREDHCARWTGAFVTPVPHELRSPAGAALRSRVKTLSRDRPASARAKLLSPRPVMHPSHVAALLGTSLTASKSSRAPSSSPHRGGTSQERMPFSLRRGERTTASCARVPFTVRHVVHTAPPSRPLRPLTHSTLTPPTLETVIALREHVMEGLRERMS